MKRLLLCAALACLCACGPDWTRPGDCLTDTCATCPEGTTQSGDRCYLPVVCPEGSTMTDGRCLLAPYCPVPLTEGECLEMPVCPSQTMPSDGFCLLTPECPEGTTYDGGHCYLDPECPEGTVRHGNSCYPPTQCPDGYALEDGSCQPIFCDLGDHPSHDNCVCDGASQVLRGDRCCVKASPASAAFHASSSAIAINSTRDSRCHCINRDPCTLRCVACSGGHLNDAGECVP